MNQNEYEEMFKENAPAEAATSDQSKGNLESTPLTHDNTDDIARAIEVLSSMVIWHPKAYDLIWHLAKLAEILKGVQE